MTRVLVVDDDELLLRACEAALRDAFDVEVARNVDAALDRLSTLEIDVVLSDFNLRDPAGRDGIWLLQQVAKRHPAARRILLSGASEAEIGERLRGEAIQTYLRKPFTLEVLIPALRGGDSRAPE